MRKIRSILILSSILFLKFTAGLAQCEIQKFIPDARLKTFNSYGYVSSMSNNYLVVNEPKNDSLAYNAGIIHLYKKENQTWTPLQKLSVQNVVSNQQLGNDLTSIDSLIVAKSILRKENGRFNENLYIYRQNQSGDWPVVETEQILLEDTLDSESYLLIHQMTLNKSGQLAVLYNSSGSIKIKILDLLNDHTILLEDTLNKTNKYFYGNNTFILFESDVLFISNPDFPIDNLKRGAVLVFEKDLNNDWSLEPTAVLTADIGRQLRFGINMVYENDKLYVANASDDTGKAGLYIFDKPTGGWSDMAVGPSIQKDFQYTGFDIEMNVKDNVIFWSIPLFDENFPIYVPDASKDNGYAIKEIRKPNDFGDENMQFGFNPIITENELILGTRHQLGNESNKQNEHVLIYDLDLNSFEDVENYSFSFNGGFISASDDLFGENISISENTMAISARGSSNKWGDRAGSVYLYEKSIESWGFQQEIIAPKADNKDQFGKEIEVYQDLLFVGAPNYDSIIDGKTFYSTGKVYVYEKQGMKWEYLTALVSPIIGTSVDQGYFGKNITYHKGYLAISETWDNKNGSHALGRVYLYQYNESNKEFNLQVQFENNETHFNSDGFGNEVLISDKYMVIGTGSTTINPKVYLYKINSSAWQNGLPDYLFASKNSSSYDFSLFGNAIALKDDLLLVGDRNFKNSESMTQLTGSVYGFRIPDNSTYGEINYEDFSINPSVNQDFSYFGNNISVNGNDLYIKASDLKNTAFAKDLIFKFDLRTINEENEFYGNDMTIITDSEGNSDFGFGSIIEANNGVLMVGSPSADTENGFKSGAVYMWENPTLKSIPNLCNNTTEYELQASPQGGTWSLDQEVLENNLLDISTLEPGNHTVTYDLNGCISETTFQVYPTTELISKSPNSITKCINDEIELFIEVNNGQNVFTWYYKEEIEDNYQLVDSALDLTAIQISEPGFYQVNLVDSLCSELEEEFQVINHELFPKLNLKGEVEYCESEATLRLENIESYEELTWYFKAQSNTSFQRLDVDEDEINIEDSGDYYCTVQNLNCEFLTDTVSVLFIPKLFPELNLKGELEYCESEVTLRLENVESYDELTWYFQAENNTLFQKLDVVEDQINIDASGDYYGVVKSLNCEFETETVSVIFKSKEQDLFIPNVSTINNDGYNDSFRIITDSPFKDFNLLIYDKYGKTIYQSIDQDFKWYAENAYAGTFFYYLVYETECGEIGQRNGWVQIIK